MEREKIKQLSLKGILRPKTEKIQHYQERPVLSERYHMIPDAIVISGPSGTGKTTFAEELASLLPEATTIYGGEWFRERIREEEGQKSHVVGYAERPKSLDQELDEFQELAFFTAANEGKKYLTEARLGIVNATNVIREAEKRNITPPNIVRILFTADEDVRLERIVNRELKLQRENPDIPKLTPEEIRERTLQREKGDLRQWAQNHDILKTSNIDPQTGESMILNPFDKNVLGPDGKPLFYDYVIDSTNISLLEGVMEAITLLENNGHIVKMEDNTKEEDSDIHVIFPNT